MRSNPKKKKNLTLTIDAGVLKAARRIALERDTSVNQMVRDYLNNVATQGSDAASQRARREQARKEIEEIFRTSKAEIGPITWTRDDLHER